MAIWEKAKALGADPGSRINVDPTGLSWVRILSPSFRLNDGTAYCYVGHGIQLIFGGVESGGGGASDASFPGTMIAGI